MRRLAVVLGLALLVGAAVAWGLPFLTKERDYVAVTPQPDPLFSVAILPLRGGQEACMDRAVLDPLSEQARFRVGTFGRAAVPLELMVSGGSYRARAFVAGDYGDSQLLKIPLRAPTRDVEVTICIRNAGSRRVALYASDDRTNSRSQVRVDGRPVQPDFGLVLFEQRPVSILERLPIALERASTFRPVVSPAILWPLLVLFVVGVPLAVLTVFAASLPAEPPPRGGGRGAGR